MNRVILIFNLVPENLQIYNLEVNDEEFEMLKSCHGKYGNCSDVPQDHPIHVLSEWLEGRTDSLIYDDSAGKHDQPYLVPGDATLLVSGFIM